MKFNEFPFLRYTLFFILGILLYSYVPLDGFVIVKALLVTVFVIYFMLVIYGQFRGKYPFKTLLPLLAYLQLVLAGWVLTGERDVTQDRNHLIHYGQVEGYMGVVQGVDEKKPRSYANTVRVIHVREGQEYKEAFGEVIVYHQLEQELVPGEVVWISGTPEQVDPPKNPGEFDYRRWLAQQQIYHRHFIRKKVHRMGKVQHQPINNWVMDLRRRLEMQMDRFISNDHSNQIAKALLLGQKKYLDHEVSEAYVTAGTMHVLAVSGLHVGIIYGFFFLFFKPYQLPLTKRVVYLSVVIVLIWLYALLTGMSPSVMRAATMFTLMGLAQMKSRSPSIFNALALSALILMLFDPFIIYAVGFQLSYAALVGILLLQPVIRSFWLPQNKVVYYVWEITSVSIAAQLMTFPISAYYFHVFPSYFLLSNLVAIPGAFLIMSIGLPFLILSGWHLAGEMIGYLLNGLIYGMNYLIFAFQNIPGARLEQIYLTPDQILLFWGLLIVAYLLVTTRRKYYAYVLGVVLAIAVVFRWTNWWKESENPQLYIYALSHGMALTYQHHGQCWMYLSEVEEQDLDYRVKPHLGQVSGGMAQLLKGGQQGPEKVVLLPGGDLVGWDDKCLSLPDHKIKEVLYWQEGTWKNVGIHDGLQVGTHAYQIIFQ